PKFPRALRFGLALRPFRWINLAVSPKGTTCVVPCREQPTPPLRVRQADPANDPANCGNLRRSGPASAGLRPLLHVLDRAEGVGDAVLAAVTDEQYVPLTERRIALRAAQRALVDRRRLGQPTRVPVPSLQRPGDDVLEATEDGPALAGRLVGAEAVVRLDL